MKTYKEWKDCTFYCIRNKAEISALKSITKYEYIRTFEYATRYPYYIYESGWSWFWFHNWGNESICRNVPVFNYYISKL